jgi:SAM-dependent methyltransferase
VLEIGGHAYSERFGGLRVAQQDVLHVSPGFPGATIVADLADAPHIPSDRFDCIILTHTLQFIHDIRAALATLHRILKPDGTLLATFPGISQICRDEGHRDADSWRFTTSSTLRLFTEAFGDGEIQVQAYGNVLASAAFLYGVATHELDPEELDHRDPDYPLLICVRARKDKNPDATI